MTILIWILIAAAAAQAADRAIPAVVSPAPPAPSIEEDSLRQLLGVRRIFVDRLTGGETAAQMRDLLVSSLEGVKLFVLTDNQERADAFLRGVSSANRTSSTTWKSPTCSTMCSAMCRC